MISFFISWIQSVFGCIKNRQQHIIIITGADINTFLNERKISPFAFVLKKKMEAENIKSKISAITIIDDHNCDYDFSVAPLIIFFEKMKLKRTTSWKLILMLLRPKALIVIDWDIALNKVCNSKKIKLYYLQHGVIASDHMYFGKNTLRNFAIEHLPYGFLSWDDISAKNFEYLCKTYVIGNQWNNGFFENTFLEWFNRDEAALALNNFKKPIILLTLTWGVHHRFIIPDYMIAVIRQTLNIYTWVIRLHPVVYMKKENRDEFEQFLDKNFTLEEKEKIFWKEFNTLPLPLILTKTKTHITIESSVVIEAAQFGITSLILNDMVVEYGPNGENTPPYGGPSYFEQERKQGYAVVYSTGLNIIDWISQQNAKEPLIDLQKNNREWERFISSSCLTDKIYNNC